jgi:hypothetical protein
MLIYKIKIKLAALRLCVCLSWFKETGGLHSVQRTWVPTSMTKNTHNIKNLDQQNTLAIFTNKKTCT